MVAKSAWRTQMLNVYLNEYEQWNAIKKWWQKYNAIVIVLFSLILLSVSGYKYWHWHQEKAIQQASMTYERMMLASANHQSKQIEKFATELVQQYPQSIYADAARLSLAKIAVADNDLKQAEEQLLNVAQHSTIPELAAVAKIRLARIWYVNKDYKKALSILKGMNSKVYVPLVDELRGDIYTAMNQFDKAVEYYRKALSEVQNYGVGNLFLEMKSNELVALSNQSSVSQLADKKKYVKKV
jgi:predicted negative regulator of RcsB-dependent stress response